MSYSPNQEIIRQLEKQILSFENRLKVAELSESRYIEVRMILPDGNPLIVTGIEYSNPYFYTVEGVTEKDGCEALVVLPYSRIEFVCYVREKTPNKNPVGFTSGRPAE